MRYLMIAMLVPASAAGCTGHEANATLADLGNVGIGIQRWAASDSGDTPGYGYLSYDASAFRAAHGGDCATLDFTGTLDGHQLDTDGGGNSDEGDECYNPSFDFSGELTGAQTLEITDGASTLVATYGADAFAPHTPMLNAPQSWTFAAGDHVDVRWSDPSDLPTVVTAPSPVYFHTGKSEDNNFFDLVPSFNGDRISWTMPSPLPRTGEGLIVFRFGYSNGDAETCTGAASCTYSTERGFSHSVTLHE